MSGLGSRAAALHDRDLLILEHWPGGHPCVYSMASAGVQKTLQLAHAYCIMPCCAGAESVVVGLHGTMSRT